MYCTQQGLFLSYLTYFKWCSWLDDLDQSTPMFPPFLAILPESPPQESICPSLPLLFLLHMSQLMNKEAHRSALAGQVLHIDTLRHGALFPRKASWPRLTRQTLNGARTPEPVLRVPTHTLSVPCNLGFLFWWLEIDQGTGKCVPSSDKRGRVWFPIKNQFRGELNWPILQGR